ncbi:C-type lectin-like 1 [Homarus americanus]|uniref:C-type lectin-like 1 n=1 Tax=Homarus americanus TaxID=6706 RepID=A0A8J5MM57_HOMAM|nr:C-type lectin-like 1 [Homarus americanus]
MRAGGRGVSSCALWVLASAAGTILASWATATIHPHQELHDVLIHLEETLQKTEGCEGRLEKLWEACEEPFTTIEGSCYHVYSEKLWPWWRSRIFCWMLGGDLAHPDNFYALRDYLHKQSEATVGSKFWLGARTEAGLEFPEWRWVDGERMASYDSNFTSLPRSHKDANCVLLDADDGYQLRAGHCDHLKGFAVCEMKTLSSSS